MLCCCNYRVVQRCSSHPPRAGGKKTKLDPRGSGQEFAGRSGRPGELGKGGDSAFRPREARERQQIRASGKAFVRSTKSSCALHGFASDVCWRVSRGPPLPSPGRRAPTSLFPPARSSITFPPDQAAPAAWSKAPQGIPPAVTHNHPPTSSPLSHPPICPDQRPAVRWSKRPRRVSEDSAARRPLIKTPPQGLRRFSGPPSAGQKPPEGPKGSLDPLGGQKSPLARNSARKKLLTTTLKSPIIFSAHQVRIASRGRAVW